MGKGRQKLYSSKEGIHLHTHFRYGQGKVFQKVPPGAVDGKALEAFPNWVPLQGRIKPGSPKAYLVSADLTPSPRI